MVPDKIIHSFLIFAILILFSTVSGFAYAQIPDYDNPFAPIYTDKEVYTWTDKVYITIVAPSWNANRNGIDSIGTQEGHFIKISNGNEFLKPYKLVETDFSSGVFVGEVTLTGFLHDVDDDGVDDTNPRTSGTGPTNGMLEIEHDGAFTISFEFADGVVLTHSASISWNVGEITFDESVYFVGESGTIKVIDPDMNLKPETIDRVKIEITSDSDLSGITVNALETEDDSGVFEGIFTFTQNSASSGNRLFAAPNDTIFAKYEDNTLPSPYGINDDLDIKVSSKLESDVHPIQRVSINEVYFSDSFGNTIEPKVGERLQIVNTVSNNQNYEQTFVDLTQIKDETGKVVSLLWIQGELAPNQNLELSVSWTPESGNYTIENYVWESFTERIALSPSVSTSINFE